jgi:hypothetical protein
MYVGTDFDLHFTSLKTDLYLKVDILAVGGEEMKTNNTSSGSTSMVRLEALEEVDGCPDAKSACLSAVVIKL